MKNKYIRLKAMLLAGTIAITGASLSSCDNNNEKTPNQAIVSQDTIARFNIGEHIISVPIEKDIRYSNVQYEYHPGYEPVGISVTAYGQSGNCFGGGAIIYVNTEEVDCPSNLVDKDGNYLYLDFGTPIFYKDDESDINNSIKEFGIGEHIISVPINEDNRFEQFQYEYHEGYEVVGIATSAHGKVVNCFGGGVLLYKNIIPVKCIRGNDGYTTFGIPFEIEKTRTLK